MATINQIFLPAYEAMIRAGLAVLYHTTTAIPVTREDGKELICQMPDMEGREYFIMHQQHEEAFVKTMRDQGIMLIKAREFWDMEVAKFRDDCNERAAPIEAVRRSRDIAV